MSIQGKAIATMKLSLEIAIVMTNVTVKSRQIHGPISEYMIEAAKHGCHARVSALSRTPHQHFNAKGKIDKRKVRKYERNRGVKVHTSRILRPVIGIDMSNGKDQSVVVNITRTDDGYDIERLEHELIGGDV